MDLDMTRFANLVEHIAMCDESSIHSAWLKKCEKNKIIMQNALTQINYMKLNMCKQ